MTLEEAKQATADVIAKVYPANMHKMIFSSFEANPSAGDPAFWDNIRRGLARQLPGGAAQEAAPKSAAKKEEDPAVKARKEAEAAKAREEAAAAQAQEEAADKLREAAKDFEVKASPDGASVIITGYKVQRWKDGQIPPHINGKPVTGIADKAFHNKGIQKLIIPDTITFIGESAFEKSKLASINLPAGLVRIGKRAFAECADLIEITIPDSITEIADSTFLGVRRLEKIILGSRITSIGQEAFKGCTELKEIIIPDSVRTIGDAAFRACQRLSSAVIGKGVTSIGAEAFYNCNLSHIVFSGVVNDIGEEAFTHNKTAEGDFDVCYSDDAKSIIIDDYKGKGKSVSFPSKLRGFPVSQIHWDAISARGLTSITIPDNVIAGGGGSSQPHVLKTITLGNNVKIEGEGLKGRGGVFDAINAEKVKDFNKGSDYVPVALLYKNNGYKAGTFTRGTMGWDFKAK